MRLGGRALAVALPVLTLLACGSYPPGGVASGSRPGTGDRPLPARVPGCEVLVLSEDPPADRHDLGLVWADCSTNAGEDRCMRGMQDEVCKLGGDTLWGLIETSTVAGLKKWKGQAAQVHPP